MLEHNPLPCNSIYVRRCFPFIAIAGEVIRPERIYGDQDNIEIIVSIRHSR